MTNMAADQRSFMYMGNQTVSEYNVEQQHLYSNLIKEEVSELIEALKNFDNSEVLKEAMDVIVVTLGLVWSMGIDPSNVWELVHKNNLSKVSNQDTIVKDVNGKIQKSPESIKRKAEMMKGIRELFHDRSST